MMAVLACLIPAMLVVGLIGKYHEASKDEGLFTTQPIINFCSLVGWSGDALALNSINQRITCWRGISEEKV